MAFLEYVLCLLLVSLYLAYLYLDYEQGPSSLRTVQHLIWSACMFLLGGLWALGLVTIHCIYRYQVVNQTQVLHRFSGCYSPRKIFGTDRWSKHAYGMAVDLNYFPETGETKVEMPVVKCFEKEGFIWGGRWKNKDNMHFEWRK
jgi:hypothetical protein